MGDQSPPPLGLKLTKSASLLEQIQKILDEENKGFVQEENKGFVQEDENMGFAQEENKGFVQEDENRGLVQEENKGLVVATNGEKQKASNFQATVLKIGSWEWTSRYAGDLVAKIYFGKKRIIWEVLEEDLKSKIEFPWSHITAFKSSLPENQSGTLTIMLNKPPMFFKETNQQAKTHTKWKPTSDFTNGQASSIYKQHVLICRPGILNKHLEKLLQSDHDLFRLSQQPEISLDTPVFDVGLSRLEEDPSVFGTQNMALYTDLAQLPLEHMPYSHEELLPSSGVVEASVDLENTTDLDLIHWNYIPDETFGISDVNSLENILGSTSNSQVNSDVGHSSEKEIGLDNMNNNTNITEGSNSVVDLVSSNNRQEDMSRNDSFSDEVLLYLPQIASPPKFLKDISKRKRW